MSITYVDPADLKPYANNAKTHPKDQIDRICALIERYGFPECKAIAIDENYEILHGHGRQLAALQLGLKFVPVQIFADLTEADKRAWRIADNAVSESEWEWAKLKEELDELAELGLDLELVGLNAAALAELESLNKDYQPQEDSTEEIDVDEFGLSHKCPRCGFEFDDD